MDEGLQVLTGLWSGQPVAFHGQHYQVNDVAFHPTPVQRPRIPVWVAGTWPGKGGPFRRAGRWDGVVPIRRGDDQGQLTPAEVAEVVATVKAHRLRREPFDVMIGGVTTGEDPVADRGTVDALAEAGATWWSEWLTPLRGDLDTVRARVRQGPPRA